MAPLFDKGKRSGIPSKSGTGSRGVTFKKRLITKPWEARIKVNGKHVHLGYFATESEAAAAYDAAARERFGKFARVNTKRKEGV